MKRTICSLAVIITILALPVLNSAGFCYSPYPFLLDKGIPEKERASLPAGFISDADLIRSFLSQYNERTRIQVISKDYMYAPYVKYASVQSMIDENPNCCSVRRTTFPSIFAHGAYNFEDRISGRASYFITYRFTAKYLDANGQVKTDLRDDTAYLTSCGELFNK